MNSFKRHAWQVYILKLRIRIIKLANPKKHSVYTKEGKIQYGIKPPIENHGGEMQI